MPSKIMPEEADAIYFALADPCLAVVPYDFPTPDDELLVRAEMVLSGVSRRQAEWIVERIVTLQNRLARIKAVRDLAVRSAQSDLNEANYLYAKVIENYVQQRTEATGESRILLGGAVLKSTRVPARPSVESPEETLGYLLVNPDIAEQIRDATGVNPMPTVLLESAVTKYAKMTGEIIPGVRMIDARKSVGISLPGQGKNGAALSIKLDTAAKITIDDGDTSLPGEGQANNNDTDD